MGILTGVAVHFVVWWITLFVVLPWGNKPEQTVRPGNIESAPANPRLLLKFAITSALAGIFWFAIWILVSFELVNLH